MFQIFTVKLFEEKQVVAYSAISPESVKRFLNNIL